MSRFLTRAVTIAALCSGVFGVLAAAPAGAAELIYFHSEACGYCDAWNEDIGGIYDKTDEARVLKLRAVSVHDDPPADLAFIKGVIYTPTFVAIEDGREIGRILGYGGDIFFWQQLTGLVDAVEGGRIEAKSACSGSVGEKKSPSKTAISGPAATGLSAC